MLRNFCVIVMQMFSLVCWQVWDFCPAHLYLKVQNVTSVTCGAECGGMLWLVTFRFCGEGLHHSQRLDVYRLFVAVSILKVSLKDIKMKWFECLSFLCFWVWFTHHCSLSASWIRLCVSSVASLSVPVPVHGARQHRNMHNVTYCGLTCQPVSNYLLWTPIRV